MKLIKARVQNFRSAEDTGEFTLDQVTSLVGKNEAGKTAVLLALAALNPHPKTHAALNKERDYPRRHLTNYDVRHPNDEALVISTVWRLDPEEIKEISEEFGPNALSSYEISISRRYAKELELKVSLDLMAAFEHLFDNCNLLPSETENLRSASDTTELIGMLSDMDAPTENHNALLGRLQNYVCVTNKVHVIIKQHLPYFMYFSNYDRMDGAIQVEETNDLIAQNRIDADKYRGHKLFVEFLEYSGVPLSKITSVQTYETFNARLQAASNNITDQILEYWTQNPDLSVSVRIEPAKAGDLAPLNSGTIARARIHNNLHRVDTPFSERSAGFVWFFSFLVKFAQVKDEDNPVVLLLDEPGLTLHGKAQGDLLKFFDEKLAQHHQIIYSTTSPFMLAADRLMSARIVEDQVEQKGHRRIPLGTKVREDVLKRDPDTLFPLQGALGYELTQTLFVGKHTLLVEGPSDILYLQAFSEALRRRRRTALDPRWTLCPAGGIDKIRPFVALFGGNSLDIAVLSDHGAGDKRKVEDIRRSDILKAGRFYSILDFVEQAEADIEDVLEPELFVDILNNAYAVPTDKTITVISLKAANPNTVRQVKQAEAAFAVLPECTEFDHFAPAAWLIGNLDCLESDTPAVLKTLRRAERIFESFNKILLP
jgi:predicted ATP-dependent endonuclease of OLD family